MPASASSTVHPGLFYPDISSRQGAMNLGGVHAVCIKRTEGTYCANPVYAAQVARARAASAFHFAYHYLTDENPKAQAQSCFDHVGPNVGLMVDVETQTQTGSKPSLRQNVQFVKHYRTLGGTVYLNYLPHWYWDEVWGKPDLAPLKNLGLLLVSSNYSGYSTHAGWAPYGGWTPTIWQYSSSMPLHGHNIDFNAFRGSGAADLSTLVKELKSIVMTGKFNGQTWRELHTQGDRSLTEIANACGVTQAQLLRATAVHYNHFDRVTHDYLDNIFNGSLPVTAKMPVGAKLWVLDRNT